MREYYIRWPGTTYLFILISIIFVNIATSFAATEPKEPQQEQTLPVVRDNSVSVQLGVNIGLLAADLQIRNFYLFGAGNIAVPLITDGGVSAFATGAGYTFALSKPAESMWFMDLLGILNPARTNWLAADKWGLGLGAGIGLRYLHHSGFTMGLKLPLLGAYIDNGGEQSTQSSVALFFLANAIALPVVSLGYRF